VVTTVRCRLTTVSKMGSGQHRDKWRTGAASNLNDSGSAAGESSLR